MQQYYYKIAKSRCERVDSVSSGLDGREDLGPSNGTMLDEDPGPLSELMQHLGAALHFALATIRLV